MSLSSIAIATGKAGLCRMWARGGWLHCDAESRSRDRSEATAEVCLVGKSDCDDSRSNQIRSDLADVAWNGNAHFSLGAE